MKARDAERQSAIEHLRSILKPGDTVYTVLRHVSRSGMTRGIDVYYMRDNQPVWITGYVGKAIDQPQPMDYWRKSLGLKIGGCGMDMGFHVVYTLGRVLFPKGVDTSYAGRDCPNDHSHHDGRTFTCPKCGAATIASYRRNGPLEHEPDGGYALNHKWL